MNKKTVVSERVRHTISGTKMLRLGFAGSKKHRFQFGLENAKFLLAAQAEIERFVEDCEGDKTLRVEEKDETRVSVPDLRQDIP